MIEERGQNLSAGIKQLICMIRALLRKSKVVIMDEPTSAIDSVTEKTIWKLIADEFSSGVTLLTIAHRANSILHYERVLVMERGSVIESGTLEELESNPQSALNELLSHKTLIERLEKTLASDDDALSFDGLSVKEDGSEVPEGANLNDRPAKRNGRSNQHGFGLLRRQNLHTSSEIGQALGCSRSQKPSKPK